MQNRVYRLDVTYPDGSDEPGWEPDGWEPTAWYPDHNAGGTPVPAPFEWPRTRLYLSRSGAENRAALFRRYGAEVTVVASDPVTWPDPE